MENRGLVSVIIPNYNHGKYLEQRIESVLNQTYPHFELIILDDCSQDDSHKIIEQYSGNPKVSKILINDLNSGSPFKQWDKGVREANGEYIWIAESDDWCEPGLLSQLVEGIDAKEGCVLAFCQSCCVESNGAIRFITYHPTLDEYSNGREFVAKKMVPSTAIVNASMAIWKKSVYSQMAKDYMNFRMCGDWLFWCELAQHGRVYISGKVLNYFRKHGDDVSSGMYRTGQAYVEELLVVSILYQNGYISFEFLKKGVRHVLKQFLKSQRYFDQHVVDLFRNELKSIIKAEPKLSGPVILNKLRYKTKYIFWR